MQELERKFLIKNRKEKDIIREHLVLDTDRRINQFYILIFKYLEVRVRKIIKRVNQEEYKIALKYGVGGERKEWELKISEWLYNLLNLFRGNNIEKIRYDLDLKERGSIRDCIVDVFINNNLRSLMVVEVEFNDIESYREYEFLKDVGEEVTENPKYKNKYLYKYINKNL